MHILLRKLLSWTFHEELEPLHKCQFHLKDFQTQKCPKSFGSMLQLLRRDGDVKDDRWVTRKVVDVAGGRVDEQDFSIRPDPVTCGCFG